MLMLSSSLPKGVAYVETKNLDGETNLKHKQSDKKIFEQASQQEVAIENFKGAFIDCEGPNEYLYKFEGNISLNDGSVIPIDPDQILLRGSCLRNTEWVIGICIYTGHETKIMKNGANARMKRSKIAKQTNAYILVTMLIQFIFSLFGSLIISFWTYFKGDEFDYIYPEDENEKLAFWLLIIQQTAVWFVALMNFVPVSLLITVEMISVMQA